MAELKYTELDFAEIKNNLKNYLKSQSQFQDYDFDGSSLSILLDVLAYNTSYNAFYLNMLASEMFLDSAYLRQNVVSRAKHLGYTPRSVKTLSTFVNITRVYPTEALTPGQVLLRKTDSFYTIGVDGQRHSYVPRNTIYFNKINSTTFKAENVELIQGKRLIHTWTLDSTLDVKQRFFIPNENIDTTTLVVTIKDSASSTSYRTYKLFDDLTQLSPKSLVYFLQEYESKKYELVFGDDILGVAPKPGNVVSVEYVVSNGAASSGANVFKITKWSPPEDPVGVSGTTSTTIDCIIPAKDYVEAESIDSIKLLAPKNYTTQNRAVTKYDYETLLMKDDPTIEHIRVWGGEENDPPLYGRVFISIKPKTGTELSVDQQQRLLDGYVKNRSIITTEAVIVNPDYIRMTVNSTVNYFSYKTNKATSDIVKDVTDAVKKYRTNSLVGFDSDFRYSRLVSLIDSVDPSIESNLTTVSLKYRLFPPFDVPYTQTIKFNNTIDMGDANNFKPSVTSSDFIYNGVLSKISDNGSGVLFVYTNNGGTITVLNQNVGSVNYLTGTISLLNLVIDSIPNSNRHLDIYAIPQENDIITYKNQILLLEDEDISISVVDLNFVKLS